MLHEFLDQQPLDNAAGEHQPVDSALIEQHDVRGTLPRRARVFTTDAVVRNRVNQLMQLGFSTVPTGLLHESVMPSTAQIRCAVVAVASVEVRNR
jgi:hypothetical protein